MILNNLKINVTSQDEITLKFRVPEWTQNTIYVDGKKVEVFDGYYSITKVFDNEDISIFFPSSLHTQGLSDNNNIVAIMDGPILFKPIYDITDESYTVYVAK